MEQYADDEQRSNAKLIDPALRVAGGGGPSTLALGLGDTLRLYRRRPRFAYPAPWRQQRGHASYWNRPYGRHLYLYDLVTRSDLRSRGLGRRLLERLEAFARAEGCENLTLSSGVQRLDAHRFYLEKMGYERPSFVFKKTLLEDRS